MATYYLSFNNQSYFGILLLTLVASWLAIGRWLRPVVLENVFDTGLTKEETRQRTRSLLCQCLLNCDIYGWLEGTSEIQVAGPIQDPKCKVAVTAVANLGYCETTKATEALEVKMVEKGVASKARMNDLVKGSHYYLLEGYPRALLMPSSQSLRT